jgi:hypothetical protein
MHMHFLSFLFFFSVEQVFQRSLESFRSTGCGSESHLAGIYIYIYVLHIFVFSLYCVFSLYMYSLYICVLSIFEFALYMCPLYIECVLSVCHFLDFLVVAVSLISLVYRMCSPNICVLSVVVLCLHMCSLYVCVLSLYMSFLYRFFSLCMSLFGLSGCGCESHFAGLYIRTY